MCIIDSIESVRNLMFIENYGKGLNITVQVLDLSLIHILKGVIMKKRVLILVVSLIGITGIIIGVSYAFFSVGGSQETANTFTSGCLSISLTAESDSINLTNAYPITDVEGLEGTSYDFTITNNCDSSTNYQINLESLKDVYKRQIY